MSFMKEILGTVPTQTVQNSLPGR